MKTQNIKRLRKEKKVNVNMCMEPLLVRKIKEEARDQGIAYQSVWQNKNTDFGSVKIQNP